MVHSKPSLGTSKPPFFTPLGLDLWDMMKAQSHKPKWHSCPSNHPKDSKLSVIGGTELSPSLYNVPNADKGSVNYVQFLM